MLRVTQSIFLFFFNDTATTEIYTLSLHDALPIYSHYNIVLLSTIMFIIGTLVLALYSRKSRNEEVLVVPEGSGRYRSEEHTSELQSRLHLVCRLLLEKKKMKTCFHATERFSFQ